MFGAPGLLPGDPRRSSMRAPKATKIGYRPSDGLAADGNGDPMSFRSFNGAELASLAPVLNDGLAADGNGDPLLAARRSANEGEVSSSVLWLAAMEDGSSRTEDDDCAAVPFANAGLALWGNGV
jgi:hypothetical protein